MNFPTDIYNMHAHMGTKAWLAGATSEQKKELMKLRMRMLTEEYAETMNAYLQGDEEELIDGLIDSVVIALGTLDIAGVSANIAWAEVLRANMAKEPGIKEERPNPLGLPDLIKPDNWTAPVHSNNHGNLKEFL